MVQLTLVAQTRESEKEEGEGRGNGREGVTEQGQEQARQQERQLGSAPRIKVLGCREQDGEGEGRAAGQPAKAVRASRTPAM